MKPPTGSPLDYPDSFKRNITLNQEEFAQRKLVLESWPNELMAVLTTRCNLKCIHCAREISNRVLPEEKAWQITELFPYLRRINWQGGEAFLVPYFKKLLLEGSRFSCMDQEITTAGVLIDSDWADILGRVGASICWSIDAVTRETYEKIRHPAKFDRLIRSLDLVHEAYARHGRKPVMSLNACVMRSNYRELEPFLDFSKRYQFESVGFLPMVHTPYADNSENIFSGELPEDAMAIEHLRSLALPLQRNAESMGVRLQWYLPSPEEPRTEHARPPETEFSCERPWHKLVVRVDLDSHAYPDCPCRIPIGNLMKDSIKELWNGPGMQEYRRRLRDQTMRGFCNPLCLTGFVDPRLRRTIPGKAE